MESDEPGAVPAAGLRLELVTADHVRIMRGGEGISIFGAAAKRVAAWHAHQLTHGESDAAIYLIGVVHGLQAWSETGFPGVVQR